MQPGRQLNITITSSTLVFKQSRLDLGALAIPQGAQLMLSLHNCTITLNRLRLRGHVTAQSQFGASLLVTASSISHNRVLVEKGSAVGPFAGLQPQLSLPGSFVADNLVSEAV